MKPKVGEILLRAGVIDEMELRAALGEQRRWGGRLGVTLVKMGILEEHDLVRALAQQLGMPVVRLAGKVIEADVLELVSEELSQKHACLPLFIKIHDTGRTLFVGMEDPTNLQALDELRFKTGLDVQPVLVAPSELWEALDRFYRRGGKPAAAVEAPAPRRAEPAFGDVPPGQESLFPEAALQGEPTGDVPGNFGTSMFTFEDGRQQASGRPSEQPAALEGKPGEVEPALLLRALIRLLIAKGVIAEDELYREVAALTRRGVA